MSKLRWTQGATIALPLCGGMQGAAEVSVMSISSLIYLPVHLLLYQIPTQAHTLIEKTEERAITLLQVHAL